MGKEHHPGAKDHPWEKIYAQNGRVFTEHLPALDEVARRFKAHHFQRVLDLGCGNGRHVVALAGMGFQVIGLDISRTGLMLSREWLEESQQQAFLIQSDTRHPLPLVENCLDGLMSTQVIHHALLGEVQLAITEIYRILKPGGLAFVTVPCRSLSQSKLTSQKIEENTYLPLEGQEAGLPHHIFNEDNLRQAFSLFEIQDVSYRDDGRILAIWVQKPA
jgi:SAM-dependent methyltransferase